MKKIKTHEESTTDLLTGATMKLLLALDNLGETYSMDLWRKTGISYAFITMRLEQMRKHGLVEILQKTGTKRFVRLTRKGEDATLHLKMAINIIESE